MAQAWAIWNARPGGVAFVFLERNTRHCTKLDISHAHMGSNSSLASLGLFCGGAATAFVPHVVLRGRRWVGGGGQDLRRERDLVW